MSSFNEESKFEEAIAERASARRFGTDQQKSMSDKDMATADAADFSKLKNDDLKRFASSEIASNMRDFPGYKKELDSAAPGLSDEATRYDKKNEAMIWAKESRKQHDAQIMEQQFKFSESGSDKAKARSEKLSSKMASQMGSAKTAKENSATASETEKPKLQASK
ncbi:hypothetical protein [Undibacterium sp. TS12]|uniref:hypothetical protein n=1 Tax=Undibacterium sp. TS12 TaxID=2908202 RepID=UPI001F4C5931|nr:hypothetical protein [Undibacterium sp. TS12]MCH8622928.1 hypothetical protein [Undibacterium sp. TS12]